MSITYTFKFLQDNTEVIVKTASADEPRSKRRAKDPAKWTMLTHCQCSNCPLDPKTSSHCPAALDMQPIVETFRALPGITRVSVHVHANERNYEKVTGLEEGLRSLMGLIMANSECPILAKLRPMAYTHLPFASQDEFIIRTVGSYLLRQYFLYKDHQQPDWDLAGLIALNRELQLVNQAVWQRVHSACDGDSNLKALLSFFTLSSSVSYSLETQLARIRKQFLSDTELFENLAP